MRANSLKDLVQRQDWRVSRRSSPANRGIPNGLQPDRDSAEQGLEEKEYAFDVDFFGEIVPEVRVSFCVFVRRELWLISTPYHDTR